MRVTKRQSWSGWEEEGGGGDACLGEREGDAEPVGPPKQGEDRNRCVMSWRPPFFSRDLHAIRRAIAGHLGNQASTTGSY